MKKICLLFIALLVPEISVAQTVQEAKVLGWLGNDVFISLEESGNEEDEEGTPVDYRASSISIYNSSIRHENPGSKKPVLEIGKSERKKSYLVSSTGPLPLALKGATSDKPDLDRLSGVSRGALSKNRLFSVSILSFKSIERKSKKARCVFSHQVRLFDKTSKQVFDVISFQDNSEFQTDRFPDCPSVNYRVFWSEDDKAFVVLSRKGNVSVYNFPLAVIKQTTTPTVVIPYSDPLFLEAWLTEDPLWMAVVGGDKYDLKSAASRKDTKGKLGYSLLQIQNGQNSRAKKAAKKTLKKMKRTMLNYTLAAVVFREAEDTRTVTRLMDKIVKKATVKELINAANLFQFFDLDIAAQLYVVALSSKKIKEENAIRVYHYLLRCLLDGGNMSAAKEVVEKVKAMKGELGIQELRYRILRREPDVLTDIQSFVEKNSANCEGYLVLGRAFGYKRAKDAMNQYLTAMQCDPNLGEAIYLLGDLQKRAGNRAEAKLLFEQYRKVSKPRKGDVVRDARRQYAYDLTHPKKIDPEPEVPKK